MPFFVIGRRYGVSGVQPSGLLLEALEEATWDESPPLTIVDVPDDIARDDGGCAI